MFGRQFRAAKHRQHLPNPNTPGYTFERIGSIPRVAGQCSSCDGMGRETYETESGTLSTQTCTACGGTGVTASRRVANDWEAIQDKVQLSGWDPMYADYIAWALDNDKDVTDTYSIVDYSDFMGLDAEDEKDIKKFVNVTAPKLYSKRRTAQTFTEWMAEAYPGKELLDLSRTERSKVLNEYQNEVGDGNEVWANRRTAFLDTVELTEPRHRVAGWNWDDHLNGFIAAEASREFTCSCGDNVPAPGYTDCRCGKRWNAYNIRANGSQKMIAREVPVRDGVVMARRTAFRKQAASPATMSDAEVDLEYQKIRRQIDKGDSTNFDRGLELRRELKSRGLPTNLKPPHIMRQEYGDSYNASRKQASDASYEGWTARIIYDEDDFEYAETTTPSGEQADSIYPMDGSHFEGGELREALEELALEWGDDAYSGTYQYNSLHKIAAPSSGADAIAQYFPGWIVDDDDGDFWEVQSPGREHAFIHEGNGVYTLLMNDNTPDEFWETGLSFNEALSEMQAEGVI